MLIQSLNDPSDDHFKCEKPFSPQPNLFYIVSAAHLVHPDWQDYELLQVCPHSPRSSPPSVGTAPLEKNTSALIWSSAPSCPGRSDLLDV